MLQITEFTEARLATVTPRSQKHGDEDVPAVSIGLEFTFGNTHLDAIDPDIRATLYKRVDGQPDLPGVEVVTPVLRCNSIDKVTIPTKYEGWTLDIDDGIDDTTTKTFGGCKVDKFIVEPKQGGTVVLRMRVGTADIDAERSGMLNMRVGQSIWVRMRAPIEVEDSPADQPTQGDAQPDAGSLFADSVDGEQLTSAPTNPFIEPASTTVVTIKRGRKGLGTDADQAARQAEVLAADDAKASAQTH